MEGAILHIKNQYPGTLWSEIFYIRSSNVGGVSTAIANRNKEGAKAIVIRDLYWVPTNGGATFQFNDQFNQVIFPTIDLNDVPTFVPILAVKKGSTLKISSTLLAINFTISYQFLFLDNFNDRGSE